jgi:hypothetical protein
MQQLPLRRKEGKEMKSPQRLYVVGKESNYDCWQDTTDQLVP